jgi:hypothetical protein
MQKKNLMALTYPFIRLVPPLLTPRGRGELIMNNKVCRRFPPDLKPSSEKASGFLGGFFTGSLIGFAWHGACGTDLLVCTYLP